MEPSNPGTKLAVAGSPQAALALVAARGLIRDLPSFREFIEAVRTQAVVLAPVAHLAGLPALHRVQVSAVLADPTPGAGDVYQDRSFCDTGNGPKASGAPTKNFLLKIMAAAGIGIGATEVKAKDNVFSASVLLIGKGLDGQQRRVMGTKIIDLTDDAPGAFKKDGTRLDKSALRRAREHGAQMAETKAILRGLRAWFGMKQAYLLSDFAKPWIIPALVLDLDAKNPEHLKYIVGMSVGATDQLFGSSAPTALLPAGTAGELPPVEQAPPDDEDVHDAELATPSTPAEGSDDIDIPASEPPKQAEPEERHVCGCACGHQAELSAKFAERAISDLGIKVCPKCVPSRVFDENSHASLKALNFPKRSEWNVVATAIKKAREERAKAAPAR